MKKNTAVFLLIFLVLLNTSNALGCTGFIAGKNVMQDGSFIIARTEDMYGAQNKIFKVYPRAEHSNEVLFEDYYGFRIRLPKTSYQYTAVCDADRSEGNYDAAGYNEYGVAMTATVSAYPNKSVLKVDPFEKQGLNEASMVTVVLPYVQTAKEALQRTIQILEDAGSAEGNIVFFADVKEIWYLEILSGHQYVAVKVPDDVYGVIPNHYLIGHLSEYDEVIHSENLISLAKEGKFYQEQDGEFHVALSYGEEMDGDSRARIWGGQNFFSASQKVDYNEEFFNLWRNPDKKISVKDIMELFRYRYEDTEWNVNLPENQDVSPIGTPISMECHILQIQPNRPQAIAGTIWLAMSNAEHSVFLPYYGIIHDTHSAYQAEDHYYSPASFYWLMRNINVISAMDRQEIGANVRRYWNEYERKLLKDQVSNDEELLDIYQSEGKDAAAKFATELGYRIAEEVFQTAVKMQSELIYYLAQLDANEEVERFTPSFMTE